MERFSERGITPINEVDDPPSREISIDSGLVLEWDQSPKPKIHGQESDSWFNSEFPFNLNSYGAPEPATDLGIFAGMRTSRTYPCDLCDKSDRYIFRSFDDLRRHKETSHGVTDHAQKLASPVPDEGLSKAGNQLQKLGTPPEPSCNAQISSRLSVCSSQGIAPSQGNGSPLGSETTDSGDTEMNVDEESLFDDHDAHLYTERMWDEATIQRLEHIYKQNLYSLVDSQVLDRWNAYEASGISSRAISGLLSRSISVLLSPSSIIKRRTRAGCLTCRRRRIKCGEERPICNNCEKSQRQCEGYTQHAVLKDRISEFGAYSTNQAPRALTQRKPLGPTEQVTSKATGSAEEMNLQGRDGTSSGRKRRADGISDEDDRGDSQDGDGDGSQEPSKPFKASKSEYQPLRLACPFFKRHPESFRTCGMSDHENSSRVKQHISRKHRMPIYCPRCSAIFKTEHARDAHVRDADCPVGPKANFICATAEQLRKLSRRNTHQTDLENWYAIYKTLFPDDPLPDSPYLDPFVSYEVNLVREAFLTAAPMAVRTAIQQVIPEEFSDSLQEELERVLRSTHAEVFDQILCRMREDREDTQVHRITTQSVSQVRPSNTPDSGIGSTVRSRSSQDEREQRTNGQGMLTSFGSGSFDLQNEEGIPFLPPLAQGFESSEFHNLQDEFFDDLWSI